MSACYLSANIGAHWTAFHQTLPHVGKSIRFHQLNAAS